MWQFSFLFPCRSLGFSTNPKEIDKRYYLLNTLFNIPEACVFAHLIEFFEGRRDETLLPRKPSMVAAGAKLEEEEEVPASQGVIRTEAMDIYFKNLWADIRESTDWCHLYTFKSVVIENMAKCTSHCRLMQDKFSNDPSSSDLVKTPKLAGAAD